MPKVLRANIDTTQDGALIITGSPNVFINGYPVVRYGDHIQPHSHGSSVVSSVMITNSATVFCNGLGICRIGDLTSVGDYGIGGSPNVSSG